MQINLSDEMIEKITCVSAGRLRDVYKMKSDAEKEDAVTDREKNRKKILLNDLNKAIADAKEVHALFLELLEQIDNS